MLRDYLSLLLQERKPWTIDTLDSICGKGPNATEAEELLAAANRERPQRLLRSASGRRYAEYCQKEGSETVYTYTFLHQWACRTGEIAHETQDGLSVETTRYERHWGWLPLITLRLPVTGGVDVTDV